MATSYRGKEHCLFIFVLCYSPKILYGIPLSKFMIISLKMNSVSLGMIISFMVLGSRVGLGGTESSEWCSGDATWRQVCLLSNSVYYPFLFENGSSILSWGFLGLSLSFPFFITKSCQAILPNFLQCLTDIITLIFSKYCSNSPFLCILKLFPLIEWVHGMEQCPPVHAKLLWRYFLTALSIIWELFFNMVEM